MKTLKQRNRKKEAKQKEVGSSIHVKYYVEENVKKSTAHLVKAAAVHSWFLSRFLLVDDVACCLGVTLNT